MRSAFNFVAFQAGWFACVLGAANGLPWIGPVVCLPLLTLHLLAAERVGAELGLMMSALAIGLVMDSFLVATGWLSYPNGMLLSGVAPYWILAIWVLFASTLNVSMRWLRGKYLLAAVFGAAGGPLSFLAGARLGAVEFINNEAALIALAVGWAVTMPVLMRLAVKFDGVSAHPGPVKLESANA